ncbi:hypothetical protein PMLGA01_110019200 [Plasmodium malariae]|uniref:Uncharacterized protein n=1 Tax=Plasmodium malariae TaxID=5858 RepID=A0A1C3KZB1_PLAMA|nr:hypothetical protein PMLGA01_110019200 [Plasmodium malariae]
MKRSKNYENKNYENKNYENKNYENKNYGNKNYGSKNDGCKNYGRVKKDEVNKAKEVNSIEPYTNRTMRNICSSTYNSKTSKRQKKTKQK